MHVENNGGDKKHHFTSLLIGFKWMIITKWIYGHNNSFFLGLIIIIIIPQNKTHWDEKMHRTNDRIS